MTDRAKQPINGVESGTVEHMVCGQIEQTYDRYRAHDFWMRLIAGDNDPRQVADGICRALSGGHYVRKEAAQICALTIHVDADADPKVIAQAVSEAMVWNPKTGPTG